MSVRKINLVDKDDSQYILIFQTTSSSYTSLQSLPFTSLEVKMIGKTFHPKRTAVTMGEFYSYNGAKQKSIPITDEVRTVMNEVNTILQSHIPYFKPLNTCVANYYPDGDAYIGKHSDDEQDTVVVAGVSFGETRNFQIYKKEGGPIYRTFELKDHECLAMWSRFSKKMETRNQQAKK